MIIKKWEWSHRQKEICIRYKGEGTMATLNNVFIVKENMTDKFIEALKKPMITKEFWEKCEKASEGINTNCKK